MKNKAVKGKLDLKTALEEHSLQIFESVAHLLRGYWTALSLEDVSQIFCNTHYNNN